MVMPSHFCLYVINNIQLQGILFQKISHLQKTLQSKKDKERIMINRIAKASVVLLTAATLSGQALAENNTFASGFYIAPGLNVMDVKGIFNKNPGVGMDRELGYNLSLGYQYDNPWAVEFMYQYTKPEESNTGNDIRVDYWHLDGLYTFENYTKSDFAPYAVAGFGRKSYDTPGFKENDNTLNAGLGAKYAFTDQLHIRVDGRGTLGTKYADVGASINTALVYVIGKSYSKRDDTPKYEKPLEAPVEEVVEEAVFLDADGDGVADHLDECADTPAGAKVDEKGCAIVLTETREFTLNVKFASGSAWLNKDSVAEISELADFLTEYPDTNVTIEGHSDSTGSAALNKRLSQQRADSVKKSLVDDYSISEDRVKSIGYGSEKPIADNSTIEGRNANRRVVAKVEAVVETIEQK